MNTEDQNQDFEKLQHLLKLKRYETPPPRYFNDFSGQVVSRIRAGKTGARYESFENIVAQTPWLHRWWQRLERQPALSGAVTAIVCGLMVAGVFLMEKTTPQKPEFLAVGEGSSAPNDSANSSALVNNFAGAPTLVSSTNLGAIRSLFDTLPTIQPALSSGTPMLQK
jgi:hypothetical protein